MITAGKWARARTRVIEKIPEWEEHRREIEAEIRAKITPLLDDLADYAFETQWPQAEILNDEFVSVIPVTANLQRRIHELNNPDFQMLKHEIYRLGQMNIIERDTGITLSMIVATPHGIYAAH